MADMKGCDRDYIAHKTKNIYSLVLYRKERKKKILPTLSLDRRTQQEGL